MKYLVDHDLHIHSRLSACSGDPEQTPEAILNYAKESGYRTVCLTDHMWDDRVEGASRWYAPQNFLHVSQSLPLPQAEGIRFLFGAETEMLWDHTLGISPERFEKLAFVIIPISHFHMVGRTLTEEDAKTEEGRAARFLDKLEALLSMPLPFHKIGLAHLTSTLLGNKTHESECRVVELLMQDRIRLRELFSRVAQVGAGIELNTACFPYPLPEQRECVLRFYGEAKACGCKFYFGSDAHTRKGFLGRKQIAEELVEDLGLREEDKIPFLNFV